MPTTRNLAQLFRALAEKDVSGATAIAAQICSAEEQKGHRSAARVLRGALQSIDQGDASQSVERYSRDSTQRTSFASAALVRLPADIQLKNVVLSTPLRRELDAVIREWSKRESLEQCGLMPRSKLLFHGPPGCGKSLTARALAHELGIPAYVVRFDAVIGAYLGQTAIHLRQLFAFAEINPCLLLLDELDALGKRRGNPLDVGELDRVVISLMQELEHSHPRGIIVGTCNLPKQLDDALWRRFDLALQFRTPSKASLTNFAKRVAAEKQISLPPSVERQAACARNFAQAEAVVLSEARRQILQVS